MGAEDFNTAYGEGGGRRDQEENPEDGVISRLGALATKPFTAIKRYAIKARRDFNTPPEVSPPVMVEPGGILPGEKNLPVTPVQEKHVIE